VTALAKRAEEYLATLALGGIMLLPLAEIFSRKFLGVGIPGSGPFAQHLTMWVGLLGAAIAAREGKLLSLATGEFLPKGPIGNVAHIIAGAIGSFVATLFAFGGVALVKSDRLAGDMIANGVPVWISDLVLPFAFGLIAIRIAWRSSPHWLGRGIAALGIIAGIYLSQHLDLIEGQSLFPWLMVVLIAGVLGAPIFTLLGGVAVFAFLVAGSKPIVLLIKASEELTTSTGLAAIPLFTLAGFLLAEGRSSERLLRVFRACFGWMPGGTAIAAATLCAFFTLFTGGSGVTILVLGGLLLPAMLKDGYRERFSIGLLTASGSLGLLFPLSLPLMLYGIVAQNLDRRSVHRRPDPRPADARSARGVRHSRRHRLEGEALALHVQGSRRGVVGSQVGAVFAGVCARHVSRRCGDVGGVGADGGPLHVARAALCASRPAHVGRCGSRHGRLRSARRRRAADSGGGVGPHELSR
jgi:TRAP-type C4-dicarboxylate transport system permease small subunit